MNTIIGLIVLFFIARWFFNSEHKLKIGSGLIILLFILVLISSGYGEVLIAVTISLVVMFSFIFISIKWEEYQNKKYNLNGFDKEGFNKQGFNVSGYNKNGLDNLGYDKDGFDINGKDKNGYNRAGVNNQGLNIQGFDSTGRDLNGFDREGFDKNSINKYGFDRNGYNTQVFPFFQRHIKLLDTNILMADKNYDGLFNFFINYGVHITILKSVFDELINIKDSRTHSQDAKRSAFVGLNRISQLQEFNLLTLVDIGIQTKGRAYADPIIIEYLKSATNQSVALITNDLDVKIRENHFKGSVDTQAVLGKDLIKKLYNS